MLRITRGEESKLTSWYFEIDRTLLSLILVLVCVSAITMISAGAAQAARMTPTQPWFYFIKKALPGYLIGLSCLFGFSMLNKRQVIRISIVGLLVGLLGLLFTVVHPVVMKGSSSLATIGGLYFMPAKTACVRSIFMSVRRNDSVFISTIPQNTRKNHGKTKDSRSLRPCKNRIRPRSGLRGETRISEETGRAPAAPRLHLDFFPLPVFRRSACNGVLSLRGRSAGLFRDT